jgi:hypothetical protein
VRAKSGGAPEHCKSIDKCFWRTDSMNMQPKAEKKLKRYNHKHTLDI